ncbi:hypothetical protein, partial [Inquilinus limosus]|uniref:hypothetical protein n=1 Tax=Inquilinus limosus TaxID=171674 RepID=UPI0013788556
LAASDLLVAGSQAALDALDSGARAARPDQGGEGQLHTVIASSASPPRNDGEGRFSEKGLACGKGNEDGLSVAMTLVRPSQFAMVRRNPNDR